MDEELEKQLTKKDRKQLKLTTRSGNPSQLAEMKRVSAGRAKQVRIFLTM